MAYPTYSVSQVSGASIQLGSSPASPIQPSDKRWCTLEDAKVILKVFTDLGIADAQLLDASVATINGEHFINVPADSIARPWYLTSSKISGPVGPALWIMYGPNGVNGGGRGNPGSWTGVLTGNPQWVPTAIAPSSTPVTAIDSSKDAAAFASVMGVPATAFSQADRDAINNANRLVIAIAKAINIK